jgi:hypothetical protein
MAYPVQYALECLSKVIGHTVGPLPKVIAKVVVGPSQDQREYSPKALLTKISYMKFGMVMGQLVEAVSHFQQLVSISR